MHLYFFPKNIYQYWSGVNKENTHHTTRGCWYTHFIGNQLLIKRLDYCSQQILLTQNLPGRSSTSNSSYKKGSTKDLELISTKNLERILEKYLLQECPFSIKFWVVDHKHNIYPGWPAIFEMKIQEQFKNISRTYQYFQEHK